MPFGVWNISTLRALPYLHLKFPCYSYGFFRWAVKHFYQDVSQFKKYISDFWLILGRQTAKITNYKFSFLLNNIDISRTVWPIILEFCMLLYLIAYKKHFETNFNFSNGYFKNCDYKLHFQAISWNSQNNANFLSDVKLPTVQLVTTFWQLSALESQVHLKFKINETRYWLLHYRCRQL